MLLRGAVIAAATSVVAIACATARAEPAAQEASSGAGAPVAAKPSDAPLPSCLDQTIAGQLGETLHPRGVQKRNFIKRGKVNLVAHGGLYAGDLTSSAWIAGGTLGFFFTEDFGIQAEFDLVPQTLDLDSPLTKFFGNNRFQPGMGYLALGNAVWSPIHAKMKMGGGIVHADVLLLAGGGRLIHDAVQGLAFDTGAALDFFVSKPMTFRVELRDLMAVEEVAAETRFTHNLVMTFGLAFWIPTPL